MRTPTANDYALLTLVGIIWGSQFIFNEWAIQSYSPMTVAAGRVFIGFLTLVVAVEVMFASGAIEARGFGDQPWGLYFVIGVVEAVLPCFLIPWGQQHVESSVAAILLATVPIFTLVLAPFIVSEERWTLPAVLSVAVGFVGVLVLIAPSVQEGWLAEAAGNLAVLAGAFCFALGLILMKRVQGVPPTTAMRNIFLAGSIPLIAMSAILDAPWTVDAQASSLSALVALGILCGGAAYVMFFHLVHHIGPTYTSLVNYPVTLIGVFLGMALMGDELGLNDYAALVLIIAALTIARWKPGGSAKPQGQ